MNKQEYLKKLDALSFDKNDYYIISGGVMVMHGLREETEDIDLKVSDSLFQQLEQQGLLRKSTKMEHLYEYGENVELKAHEFRPSEIEMVDGYPVNRLESELAWKLEHHRAKDVQDIKRIQNYLQNKEKN